MPSVPDRLSLSLAGRYRLERGPTGEPALLGEGGTATVYLAHDLRHDRPVALKVVHPQLTASVGAERFLREIRFIARLSHPHILPLFDSGDADGLLFYVMPCVTGESLRGRLAREGRLPVAIACRVTREVALALDYAHRNGVVHRDIKPENILFEDEQAVVADFGIATAMEVAGADRLTIGGVAVGTPKYMSPEQAGGAATLDGRSDLYSLACVLYEMLAGVPPFTGTSPRAIMAQQVVAPAPPVRGQRPEVPEAVERALVRALAKEPDERFATAAEFASELESAAVVTGEPPALARPRRPRVLPAALLGLAAVAIVGLAVMRATRGSGSAPTIVVLPFEHLGPPEDNYFTDGITEEITSRLAMLPRLAVISRTSADQYRRSEKPLREIGRELGAEYVLEGSVRWEKPPGRASRVRVTPQLIRAADDHHLWAAQYDETLEEVFGVQSRIAQQVAGALDVALQAPEQAALETRPTDNLRAYDFYLRGNDYFANPADPQNLRTAADMFARAGELDPDFALAFARLARARIWRFHFQERTPDMLAAARSAADSALALQPRLAEGHLALGFIHYWGELDYGRALREFRTAQAGDPGNSDVAWARGLVERRLGRWDDAIGNLRHAAQLDPRSLSKSLDLFEVYVRQRKYEEAEPYVERALELAPESPAYIYKVMLSLVRDGDLTAAARVLEDAMRRARLEDLASWAPRFDPAVAVWTRLDSTAQTALDQLTVDQFGGDSGSYFLGRGRILQYRGRAAEARVYFDSAAAVLERRSRALPDDPTLLASLGYAYAGAGRRVEAVAEARRAVELRPPGEDTWLGVDMVRNLATVYARLGMADSAVRQLQLLLAVPSWISLPLLRVDPTWDPIRRDPAFRQLLRGTASR
jgi:eukaryotic-like serine/threonine-protein kinase